MTQRAVHLLIPALGLVAALALVTDEFPLREVLVAVFLAVGPGFAVLSLTGVTDRLTRIALLIPLSLAIDLLVVSMALYLGLWSPELVMTLLVIITVAAIAMAPYEWPARVALLAIALLPGLAILAGELSSVRVV